MAPKKPLSTRPPPPSSSSSEEESDTEDEQELPQTQTQKSGTPKGKEKKSDTEEDDEENGEDDEEEEEEDVDEKKKPAVKVPVSKSNQPNSHESDSESGTESGNSQLSPSPSDFEIAPISSKPMDDSTKYKKDSMKRNVNISPAATPVKTLGSKRASESETDKKDSKKKKVSNGGDEEDGKKVSFQRVWSEEDEIEILKAMIDYRTKKGSDPYADMGAFYEFVNKRVHANVSKNQVIDKIRRLKKKYQTYADKSVDGKDPVLAKSHEQQAYVLSKKIWGSDSVENGEKNKKKSGTITRAKNNGATPVKRKEVDTKDGDRAEANAETNAVGKESFFQSSALLSVLEAEDITSDPEATSCLLRAALPLIDSAKAKEFDQKWKELQREQIHFFIKKTSLVLEGAKLVLEAVNSDKSLMVTGKQRSTKF